MSEHAWVLENIAAFQTGGLETAERERLEQHIASCEPCAQALGETRGIDQALEALFTEICPDAALEDRMIRAFRTAPLHSIWYTPLSVRGLIGVAAVLLLGVLGAGVSNLVAEDRAQRGLRCRAPGLTAKTCGRIARGHSPAANRGC